MPDSFETRHSLAALILNIEDVFARTYGIKGFHPRPIGPLHFWLVKHLVNGVAQKVEPPWQLLMRQNDTGYYLFFGTVRLPGGVELKVVHEENGVLIPNDLTGAVWDVRVTGPYYRQFDSLGIPFPDSGAVHDLNLRPGYAYPFPTVSALPNGTGSTLVRGLVRDQQNRGIANSTVTVQADSYVTDDTGQWVLDFPDTQPAGVIAIQVTLEDGTVINTQANITPGQTTTCPPIIV